MAHDWFDELPLDPPSGWLRMGTMALGAQPWLLRDQRAGEELALKRRLLTERRDDVLRVAPGSDEAVEEVLRLVRDHVDVMPDDSARGGALERAARAVQEDLVLLQRRDGRWHLDAACVCFPSRWRLAEKFGRPLTDVHGPVPGYDPVLAARVDRLLDRLTDRPVRRRNWFVHPDGALFQPEAPERDPVVPAGEALDRLHLRSERQTLRRLPSGWVLFTIRVQQATLREVLDSDDRRERFAGHLRAVPAADLDHRGMAAEQVRELIRALGT